MDTGYPIFSYIAVSLLWLCIPISGKWRDVVGFLQESEDSFPSNRGLSHPRVIREQRTTCVWSDWSPRHILGEAVQLNAAMQVCIQGLWMW